MFYCVLQDNVTWQSYPKPVYWRLKTCTHTHAILSLLFYTPTLNPAGLSWNDIIHRNAIITHDLCDLVSLVCHILILVLFNEKSTVYGFSVTSLSWLTLQFGALSLKLYNYQVAQEFCSGHLLHYKIVIKVTVIVKWKHYLLERIVLVEVLWSVKNQVLVSFPFYVKLRNVLAQ